MEPKNNIIYGVGVNDADYNVTAMVRGKNIVCHFYRTWRNMMERCYSKSYLFRRPFYIGCSVDSRWTSFMEFKSWMETQDWEGKELDKDIMYPGNKVYGPDTCVFVSQSTNKLLTNRANYRGNYALGVDFVEQLNKFRAQINKAGKRYHLGTYDTERQAENAYWEEKRKYILQIACCEPSIRVKQGLYRHISSRDEYFG